MTVLNLVQQSEAPVQKNHRGPGRCNLAAIRACHLAGLAQGTASWASSPKQIVKGVGAPVSPEYLRRALKLHPEARREVEMGRFPLVSVNTSIKTEPTTTAVTRLERVVSELGVSATFDLLAAIAARVEAA